MNKEPTERLEEPHSPGERLVWVYDPALGYRLGKTLNEKENKVQVEVEGAVSVHTKDAVHKANPDRFDLVENMEHLSHLNEPSILHNLHQRYLADMQYTYSGLFLVAVNPYKSLPIYTKEFVGKYAEVQKREEAPPHIYAVATEAYHLMRNTRVPQTILITGESGAGKTENTKYAIGFLTKISGNLEQGTGLLEERLMWANPLLEAFGNAQTERNNNSSRFGKFIRIDFGERGEITGGSVERYLLEASRVTKQSPGERNYHIFYALTKDTDEAFLSTLFLEKGKEYRLVPPGDAGAPIVSFASVISAMAILGIPEEERAKIFGVLGSVVHLGEVVFAEKGGKVFLDDRGVHGLECASRLLGVESGEFLDTLLCPRLRAGHDMVVHGRTAAEANFTVTSLCKVLYERVFDWVVSLVNASLQSKTKAASYIGVLDIAGFEILERNGFEQLCINYTNEKLQQFFNHRMFVLEQEVYMKEGLEWSMIDFGLDLQPTIDLLEQKDTGLFSLLDEECVVPGGSDARLLGKVAKEWGRHEKFAAPKLGSGFSIRHYAGEVVYNEPGWIVKNKDPLDEAIASFVLGPHGRVPECKSTHKMFTRFRTVAQRHKQQLADLLGLLYTTNPHFVRCILPNTEKKASVFDSSKVLSQLRCNGVLEGVRISRQGFPTRVPFPEFVGRYAMLAARTKEKGKEKRSVGEGMSVCEGKDESVKESVRAVIPPTKKGVVALLEDLHIPGSLFRLGKTLLFLRQGVLADLEELRTAKMSLLVYTLQKRFRVLLENNRERLQKEKEEAVAVVQKNLKIFAEVRNWSWWKLCMKVRPLLEVRKAEDEIKKRDRAIETQKRDVALLEERLKALQSEYDTATREIQKALSQTEQQKSELEIEKSAMQRESTEMKKELCSVQKASARSLQTIDALKQEVASLKEAVQKAKEEAASESNAKLLSQISKLAEQVSSLEKTNQGLQKSLAEETAKHEMAEHEKGIFAQEKAWAEEKHRASVLEIEELQSKIQTAEAFRYKAEVSAENLKGETERLGSSLKFEREKYTKLEEAFKRASAPLPAPVIQAPAVDNTEEIAKLKEALLLEKDQARERKKELEDLKKQYLMMVDKKLGEIVSAREKMNADAIKNQQALADIQIRYTKEKEEKEAALFSRDEAMRQKHAEAEKRKAAEEKLALRQSAEAEAQHTISMQSAQIDLLQSKLNTMHCISETAVERRTQTENELIERVLEGLKSVEEATVSVENVSKKLVSSSAVIALYQQEIEKLVGENLLLEQDRRQFEVSLQRVSIEASEYKESASWHAEKFFCLEKERTRVFAEMEHELAEQRSAFDEEEQVWHTQKKDLEREKRQLLKELKEKSREVQALKAFQEECRLLQAQIARLKEEEAKQTEELVLAKEQEQSKARALSSALAKEKEKAEHSAREALHYKSALSRAKEALSQTHAEKSELSSLLAAHEKALVQARITEKELALEMSKLHFDMSVIRCMGPSVPASEPIPK
ncbi:myosin heavy chain 9/10/11/14 [Nematocida sp. AWRm77]|nr:myosin heavy chain 9/10/11/14 [Nematocida sp. AWRm77]